MPGRQGLPGPLEVCAKILAAGRERDGGLETGRCIARPARCGIDDAQHIVGFGMRSIPREHRLHVLGGNRRFAAGKQQLGEVQPRVSELRPDPDAFQPRRFSAGRVALEEPRQAEIVPGLESLAVNREAAVESLASLVEFRCRCVGIAQIEPAAGIGGVKFDGSEKMGQCVAGSIAVRERDAEIVEGGRAFMARFDRAGEERQRTPPQARLSPCERQIEDGDGEADGQGQPPATPCRVGGSKPVDCAGDRQRRAEHREIHVSIGNGGMILIREHSEPQNRQERDDEERQRQSPPATVRPERRPCTGDRDENGCDRGVGIGERRLRRSPVDDAQVHRHEEFSRVKRNRVSGNERTGEQWNVSPSQVGRLHKPRADSSRNRQHSPWGQRPNEHGPGYFPAVAGEGECEERRDDGRRLRQQRDDERAGRNRIRFRRGAPVRGAFGPLEELIQRQQRKHGGEQAALLGDPRHRLNLERVQREHQAAHDRRPGLCGESPQDPHNEQRGGHVERKAHGMKETGAWDGHRPFAMQPATRRALAREEHVAGGDVEVLVRTHPETTKLPPRQGEKRRVLRDMDRIVEIDPAVENNPAERDQDDCCDRDVLDS